MKITIIGANGQLGTDLVNALAREELVPLTHDELDICDAEQTRTQLVREHPDVVINTAAYHRVDECELHIERAFAVNAAAVRTLALICRDLGATLVHFSTDYVFRGDQRRPYTEDDLPGPLSAYGVSKLAGEHFVQALCEQYFLVRTCGLYGVAGSRGKGGNFVESMITQARAGQAIRVVDDQILTPTSTEELARKVAQLIRTREYGLYHLTSNGECSWYEFAKAIFTLLGWSANLSPMSSAAFGARAKRPPYSVLAHTHLARLGLDDLRPWQEALRSYLEWKGYVHEIQ